ncbi:MAG: ATP-binding cassette domain-containing protein [Bifidobacteriaceae bacterium]|jgi:energy-coupling factor transport system ATP-binding protein|nr:ATP-binding cassette domain-containing protein [Bifidobacteriaceae bacterium]MCI1978509.1 ATP-binding cassette domain-containing protein [Bifidobacteriaceae bacterium]
MALISVRDFGFAFPQGEPLLHSVSCDVEEGSFTVLLGANGSGKTTFLKQLHPVLADAGTRTGSVLWQGKPLTRDSSAVSDSSTAIAEDIGFVMQRSESQIVTDKVWHELAFGLENLGLPSSEIQRKVAEISTFFGIQEWFDKDVSELSGGQKQILNLASSMVMNPRLLILDEPTAQLDPISADSFIQMLHRLNYELGVTILVAEHELQKILPFATQLLFMAEGHIAVSGTPQEAIPQIMRRYPQYAAAMPQAAQIFMESRTDVSRETSAVTQRPIPLTIGEGQQWIESMLGEPPQRTQKERAGREPAPVLAPTLKHESESGPVPAPTPELSSAPKPASGLQTEAEEQSEDERVTAPVALEARNLWFRYGAAEPDLLRGLDLSVRKGEILALVGSNGSGKSTLISLLSGVRRPYRGSVRLEGKRLTRIPEERLFDHYLGVLPQDPQTMFVKSTVSADLASVLPPVSLVHRLPMVDRLRGRGNEEKLAEREKEEIAQGAEALGITEVLDRHPFDLSGGEQQLVALLKVLLLRPRILLLDEPTKGLDEEAKKRVIELLQLLKNHGVTTVMVTHDIEFAARAADRAGLFFNGRVVSVEPVNTFFSSNNFYTTSASRIARDWFPEAVTKDEVIACLKHSIRS